MYHFFDVGNKHIIVCLCITDCFLCINSSVLCAHVLYEFKLVRISMPIGNFLGAIMLLGYEVTHKYKLKQSGYSLFAYFSSKSVCSTSSNDTNTHKAGQLSSSGDFMWPIKQEVWLFFLSFQISLS